MNFDIFKHPDVRHALELRKQGKYKEAIVFLDKACTEGDGEAWYIKGYFYQHGGCGLRKNYDKSEDCFNSSMDAGCRWDARSPRPNHEPQDLIVKGREACMHHNDELSNQLFNEAAAAGYFFALVDTYDNPVELREMIADSGDGVACLCLAEHYYGIDRKKALYYDRKGAEQKILECWYRLTTFYNLKEVDVFERAKWKIKSSVDTFDIIDAVIDFEREWYEVRQRLFYMAGRKVAKHWANGCTFIFKEQLLSVYRNTWASAHNATVTFLLCCKEAGVYKDVAKIIGKLIWESRTNPILWEKVEKNKKIKLSN